MVSLLRVMKTFYLLLIPRLWYQINSKQNWNNIEKKSENIHEKQIQKNARMIGLVMYLQNLFKSNAKHMSY